MEKRSTRVAASGVIKIILKAFLCLILLELGLRLAGSAVLSWQERNNRIAIRQKGAYRIMCLGESTTAVGGRYSYPSQLQEILNQSGLGVKFSVINKGVPGINTSDILDSLESNLDWYRPDMVISMMGVCDLGSYMLYSAVSDPWAINFLRSLRIYKLARILWQRIITDRSQPVIPESRLPRIDAQGQVPPLSNELLELEKAKELKSQNEWPYVEIGQSYRDQCKLSEAEVAFRKAIALNPKNYWSYAELGWLYRVQGKFSAAEASFRKAKELNPENDWPYEDQSGSSQAGAAFKKAIEANPLDDRGYLARGLICRAKGEFPAAEASFKKAIEINPQNNRSYFELGGVYEHQARYSEAEAVFNKVIELNPMYYWPYVEAGRLYLEQGKALEAEAAFRKAIELNPQNDWAYVGLGQAYLGLGKFTEAEGLFKKAIEVNPQDDWLYLELGSIYRDHGRYPEAEALFKKAVEINPRNDRACRTIKVLYLEMGKSRLAREYDKKANELRADYYPQVTTGNYHKLKAILDKRGIVYVCAQYPLRGLEPLKRIFRGGEDNIIFVDNQKVFQEALKKKGYKEYFMDMCDGDFGHCTLQGNRLLAQNIANIILNRVFSVKSGVNAAFNRRKN